MNTYSSVETARRSLVAWSGHQGAYVSVKPSALSIQTLSHIARSLGVHASVVDVFEYHCTVMYSKVTPTVTQVNSETKFQAWIDRIDYWLGHDGDGYIVVILNSDELKARHLDWKGYGAVHSFDDYTPHVTLATKLAFTPELGSAMAQAQTRFAGTSLEFLAESCVDLG